MDLALAFRYVFDDPAWTGKVVVVITLTFATIVLMPFLFLGLAPLCVLLGYMLEIVNNIRQNKSVILPEWDEFTNRMMRGTGVLLALLVYNLPLAMLGCCLWITPSVFNDSSIGSLFALTALCCLAPFSVLYIGFTWPMQAVATAHYARGESMTVYFQVGRLWTSANRLGGFSIQWLLATLMTHVIFIVVGIVPCIGWLIAAGLSIPVHAHLLGQYARYVDKLDAQTERSRQIRPVR